MQVRKNVAAVALFVCSLAAMGSLASADVVSTTDANLLQGMTASASSEFDTGGTYYGSNAVNGSLALFNNNTDWISTAGSGNQRLFVSGFNSAIETIRVWGYTDIPIYGISVQSSTTKTTSTNPSDYETVLVSTTSYDGTMSNFTMVNNTARGDALPTYYRDYAVSAPAGTQSLFFDFGNAGDHWVRIIEVQAFAPVPEPSTLLLGGMGLISLTAYAWRRRK